MLILNLQATRRTPHNIQNTHYSIRHTQQDTQNHSPYFQPLSSEITILRPLIIHITFPYKHGGCMYDIKGSSTRV